MVDVSDVTTCQNKHARVFCVCDVTDRRTFFSESSFEMPVLNTKHQTTLIYFDVINDVFRSFK
jgi:hypothetical protein